MLRLTLASIVATCAIATRLVPRAPDGIPPFVVKYAPMVYLHLEETYLPSDINAQLINTEPRVNATVLRNAPSPLTLENLADLNDLGGKDVYLTSTVKPDEDPEFLHGVLPDSDGKTDDAVSSTIIVNDHGDGTVDAFYFYFYAFDQGPHFLFRNIGNHVGDWEHNMIRFVNETPKAIWYSQHSNGQAFKYEKVHKYNGGDRPIAYSANGTHAVYATDGTHAYGIPNLNLPLGFIQDYTDDGPHWDPVLSAYWYSYDNASNLFTAYNSEDPIDWLYFIGHWGDKKYIRDDPSQDCLFEADALCKYTNGTTGPIDKQLQRKKVCPDNGIKCIVRNLLVQRDVEGDETVPE